MLNKILKSKLFVFSFLLIGSIFLIVNANGQVCTTAKCTGSWIFHDDNGGSQFSGGSAAANMQALYYAYFQSGASGTEWPNNCTYSFTNWLNNFQPGGWWLWGYWNDGDNSCPAKVIPQYMVVIEAYDPNPNASTHAGEFIIYAAIDGSSDFNFDSGTGGAVLNATAIPQPTITGIGDVQAGTVDVGVQWTEPTSFAHQPASLATNVMYGYQLYYLEATTASGGPSTAAVGSWTAANQVGGGLAISPIGTTGGTKNIVLDNVPKPASGNGIWISLSILGAGDDLSKGRVATGFQTGWIGKNSTNYVQYDPAAIDLLNFSAKEVNLKAKIKWATGSEHNTAGFNILRANRVNGKRVKVNSSLIPAQGTSGMGGKYFYTDTTVRQGNQYFYWLQEVENDSSRNVYGSVSVVIPGKTPVPIVKK